MAVLGQIFAMMSSVRSMAFTGFQLVHSIVQVTDLSNTSVLFHGFGQKLAKIADRANDRWTAPITSASPEVELDTRWRSWAAHEMAKRASNAHYVFDGCLGSIFGTAPVFRHMYNPMLTAESDDVFMASSASAWEEAMQRHPIGNAQPFCELYRAMLSTADAAWMASSRTANSIMNAQTVLEGLYSLISEWVETNGTGIGVVEMPAIGRALARFYQTFLQGNPSPDLIHLHARWHAISIFAAENLATQVALISQVNVFVTPPGRRAFLHAWSIRQIAEGLPIAASRLPHFIFPVCIYSGATLLLRYLSFTSQVRPLAGDSVRLALEEPVDWLAIGSQGFESSHQADNPHSETNACSFIAIGGSPSLYGVSLGALDLYPLWAVLDAFAHVWPISRSFSKDVEERSW